MKNHCAEWGSRKEHNYVKMVGQVRETACMEASSVATITTLVLMILE